MATNPSKPPVKSRNTLIAETCGGLAGLAADMAVIDDMCRLGRVRITALHSRGILTAIERAKLDEIDNALLSTKIELQDYHPVPKEIEAQVTKRERQ